MSELIHKCMTKATTAESEDIRRSFNWVVSRRGNLRIYSDALECGNWHIPYPEIDEAVLFKTRVFFITCYVLRIKSKGTIYQFGLNPGKFWKNELPFPVKRDKLKLKYSSFSIIIRVIAVIYLLYYFINKFLHN